MRQNSSDIAAVIRERICLHAGAEEMVLHEGQLATEFGVSRTPIRQVLQMLAYESLVETRSGIGTIVPPLLAASRDRDETAFRAILAAAAACPSPHGHIPETVRLRLGEGRRALRDTRMSEAQALFASLAALLDATVALIGDHIVVTALRAAYWRHIRWTIAQDSTTRAAALTRLRQLIADSEGLADADDLPGLLMLLTRNAI
ncbi:GntR family transcriptional regulator [Pseudooceanicola sediminis]|uniref:GntR family transcriptional regulator n=1 Tax=Pseudooceanicola sediminis TaxID=2211117 RepID=A0A399IWI3_9RHOB|nr:GntR family transcriptional regulator [Pseudooceanicola sediminis]KAA2312540.1 GntR family transcriptional regulator [Puniceibacterium sp. HSS470]RII37548.1 GntR family transcriptional regulator [Pseudooceanicola sediminis]|tara:strand:- start:44320 stop:44928 length:609 start_codon:yes stop_codon:yes gene_type:complete